MAWLDLLAAQGVTLGGAAVAGGRAGSSASTYPEEFYRRTQGRRVIVIGPTGDPVEATRGADDLLAALLALHLADGPGG